MWKLEKFDLKPDELPVEESLFSLGNGYLGIRGCFEEGYPEEITTIRGTYINGFYDLIPAKYTERLSGFTEVQEKLPNLIDAQGIIIYLDDERVSLFEGQYSDYRRTLHLDKGFSERLFKYKTASGKAATIRFKRMISFAVNELFLNEVYVEYDGEIKVESTIDANVTNYINAFDPRVGEHAKLIEWQETKFLNEKFIAMRSRTYVTDFDIGCIVYHNCSQDGVLSDINIENKAFIKSIYSAKGKIQLTKYAVYTDNRFDREYVLDRGRDIIEKCIDHTFDEHVEIQKRYLDSFWEHSDIQVSGDTTAQQSIRFSLFQLLQSTGRDGRTNIPAKGLTGEGYEGHYFWDTEIYMLPVIQLTQPDLARQLLIYRYSLLDAARDEAKALGHRRGVKYPWRTIAGKECSTFFPAGTAQYHINADIAYAFVQYYLQYKDMDFVYRYAAEVLIETARLWLDTGHFYEGWFVIHNVTGPDEYSCIVENNFYTNAMAQYNLMWAVKLYRLIESQDKEEFEALNEKLSINSKEIDEMQKAYENMYLPFDKKLNIHKQDDAFLEKEIWDFENTPEDKYPLLLHYHPLTIYRYQVLKQPDTVLAHMLLEDTADEKVIKDSFDYYEKLTTHDSSLSACVHGIMASRCGYYDKAYEYFRESVCLDLEDTHGNTKDGLHMANLGGTLLSVVYGFAGYRLKESGISFAPWCPPGWDDYSFKVYYQSRELKISISDKVTIELMHGEKLDIKVYEKTYQLEDIVEIPVERGNEV